MIPMKLFFKKNFLYIYSFLYNFLFFDNDDKSYTMVDLYLNDRFLGCKGSYNYYDINVDNILLFKKSNNEYIARYNDVKK